MSTVTSPTSWPCRDCGGTVRAGLVHRCPPGKLSPSRRPEPPSVQTAADEAERGALARYLRGR